MYSRPRRIISDRGTCFTSTEFRRFVEEFDIQHVMIATGVPRANGQVEVVNRTLTPMLAKLCDTTNSWDKHLEEAEFALNNTLNSSAKEVPAKLLFGVTQRGQVSDRLRDVLLTLQEDERDLEGLRCRVVNNMKRTQEYSKIYYDKRHKEAISSKFIA
ncbi:hypothetical protein QE152_g33938 [Popillia japonica]|uniref:Integrase catalytic domain-containing protein n=1 Tax=Popillia japonica TaxID=7064 RepID=A0AAW1IVF3_POPJA